MCVEVLVVVVVVLISIKIIKRKFQIKVYITKL